MSLMKFSLPPHEFTFDAGANWPARQTTQIFQVQDRTAAGTLQVETLGIKVKTRTLEFTHMKQADYDNLIDWFENVVNGGEYIFEFTDEYGVSGNVRVTNSLLDFQETFLETWAGSLTLEYV